MYNEMKKILFDEKGSRVLVMKNEDGEEVKFLQVYAVVLENDIYCILSPTVIVNDIKSKTGFVFRLLESGELVCETDTKTISAVFEKYYADLSRKDVDKE